MKCVCQALNSEPNWGRVDGVGGGGNRKMLTGCIHSCHRNHLSASVRLTLLFLTANSQCVFQRILYFPEMTGTFARLENNYY